MPAPAETPRPVRHPALTAAAALGLTVLTGLVVLAFLGKFPPAPRDAGRAGTVFYVVAYHYGYAFYDRTFTEVAAMEVKAGEPVTLYIVPSPALPPEKGPQYGARSPARTARPFRDGGPQTLREAVERSDPTIKTVTFTTKRVGAYDVLCVDSGMDGAGTCGWGHKWMVAKGAFVVRPPRAGARRECKGKDRG